jgi:putative transposase
LRKQPQPVLPPSQFSARELVNLKTHQMTRLHDRTLLLNAFDHFKGDKSDRQTLGAFVSALRQKVIHVPGLVRSELLQVSARTLKRYLAARRKNEIEKLAGRWSGGRRSVLARSPEASDWLVGAHITQPHLSVVQLAALMTVEFPEGVPDDNGILMSRPGEDTIARFLKSWLSDPLNRQAMVSLTDPDRYKSHYRFAGGNASHGVERLNQRWQIDASPADAMCIDGRYSIYVVIDIFSRRMMALVSRTPKTVSALLLIKRACLAWGVPDAVVTDQGADFTSLHFRDAILRLEIQHVLAPPYSPEKKAFIERGIGTIQRGLMAMLPGFKGHNVSQASEIRARRSFSSRQGEDDTELFSISLTGAQLQDRLDAWLSKIYARKPHRGLDGMTPEVRALQGAAVHVAEFPSDAAIGILLMPPPSDGPTRIVTKKGVAVGGLDYWCDGLLAGQRVQVRLDPNDLGQVYLYTDTNPWRFIGIAQNPEVKGINRADLTARVRTEQDKMVMEQRKKLRQLKRRTNLPAVVEQLIGQPPTPHAPASDAASREPSHRVQAVIEATVNDLKPRRVIPQCSELEQKQHAAFVADFYAARDRGNAEESPEDRYGRWKRLRTSIAAGEEISADSHSWFNMYATQPECRARQMVEEEFGL